MGFQTALDGANIRRAAGKGPGFGIMNKKA